MKDHFYTPPCKNVPASGFIQERVLNVQRKLSRQSGGKKCATSATSKTSSIVATSKGAAAAVIFTG